MQVEKTRKMVDTAIEELTAALEGGRSDTLKAYLAAMGRFHRYSLGNAMLIALARPGSTRVAGFRTWQKLGRQVRKGEHGIAIMAPIRRRRSPRSETNATANPGEASLQAPREAEQAVVGFRTAHVFDVGQTEGKEVPAFAAVRGDPGEELARLKQHVAAQGLRLQYASYLYGAEGMSSGGTIVLRTGQAPAEGLSTLAHEVAHEALHHDGVERPKVVKETEAEAVAYAVCAAVGLELNSASCDYISLYDGKKETLMASLERIRRVAGEIIEAVMPQRKSGERSNEADSEGVAAAATPPRQKAAA